MKKNIICSIILVVIALGSCKKKDDPTVGFIEEIQKIVPDEILTDVKSKGMLVNEGKIPPNIEGIYKISLVELLSPYGRDDNWQKGQIIDNYYFKFSNQSSDKKTVLIDYTNGNQDKGSGLGSFVSGNGNKFSVFAETSGVESGIKYISLTIISGELNEKNEIKDFHWTVYLKEKSENPGLGVLMPVKTGRIWLDKDKISERISTLPGILRMSNDTNIELGVAGAGLNK